MKTAVCPTLVNVLLFLALLTFILPADAGVTTRVSVASDGTQGNRESYEPALSADGRYVAFESETFNLVPGDTNGYSDIFVHDRATGTTERVSVASNGTQGNHGSYSPSLSADGRYVEFTSVASNLVSGDTNGHSDIFVHDRMTGATERVSVAGDGTQGNGSNDNAHLCADGCCVVFESDASNLVSGDTNGHSDIFVHNRVTGATERVSVAGDGTQGNDWSRWPSLSADAGFAVNEEGGAQCAD